MSVPRATNKSILVSTHEWFVFVFGIGIGRSSTYAARMAIIYQIVSVSHCSIIGKNWSKKYSFSGFDCHLIRINLLFVVRLPFTRYPCTPATSFNFKFTEHPSYSFVQLEMIVGLHPFCSGAQTQYCESRLMYLGRFKHNKRNAERWVNVVCRDGSSTFSHFFFLLLLFSSLHTSSLSSRHESFYSDSNQSFLRLSNV